MRLLFLIVICLAVTTSAGAAEIRSSIKGADLPEKKQTTLDLYLSSADAVAALDADPRILFLDVRDPIEVNFVGHPEPIDAIVPFVLFKLDFDEKKGAYKGVPNADFVKNVDTVVAREGLGKSHPVFVMCRSGGRSAKAANTLAKAGYNNVWSLVEGFEGDKDKSGMRTIKGWRNAGLPWKYELTPKQVWLPSN